MIARIRRRLAGVPQDRGMTLVELLVYMILLGIVVGIIASVLINSLQKQREIVHISEANNTGQGLTSRVDLAVKNAVNFRIVESSGDDSVLLVTKTRSTTDGMDEADVARCVGFYYDATTDKLHSASDMLTANGNPRTETITDSAGLAAAQNWPVVADGIQLAPAADGTTSPIFTKGNADPSKVEINFMIDTLDGKGPVTFQLTSGMRGSGSIDDDGTC